MHRPGLPHLLPDSGQATFWPLGGDTMDSRGLHSAEALHSHLLDHLQATGKRKSGMLMGVHSVGCPELIGCLATSSLSNPIRMNTGYNLLNPHT
jgi:hypothetical protein